MIRRLILILGLCAALPTFASHQWAGIDLCEVRKDVVPPGFPPDQLPAPGSEGARLLQRYCAQCHNLPGPGRHTAAQWRQVAPRMFLLMEVTQRFGGLLNELDTPQERERARLLAYLEGHALKPWSRDEAPPAPYQSQCGGCHTLPDPAQHSAPEWNRVLARMQRNAEIMGKALPSASSLAAIRQFLGLPPIEDVAETARDRPVTARKYGSLLALGPFLLLTGIGLVRWWRMRMRVRATGEKGKPCAIP